MLLNIFHHLTCSRFYNLPPQINFISICEFLARTSVSWQKLFFKINNTSILQVEKESLLKYVINGNHSYLLYIRISNLIELTISINRPVIISSASIQILNTWYICSVGANAFSWLPRNGCQLPTMLGKQLCW